MDIKNETISLIDSLKASCQSYGLGNDGNEYKIITQVFLYKFLNDKFGYEIKQLSSKLANSENWEQDYKNMDAYEKDELLDRLSPDVPRLEPEHLISNLWNQQSKENFDEIFDDTMTDIADKNIDVFSTQTSENTKIALFEPLTNYVDDAAQRTPFARALVDKLAKFSFEKSFRENYDFFATIFEYLIKDYNTAGGGKYAEYYTPHAIATIMARLLVGDEEDLHNIEVYDPSAGTGTLLMALAHQVGEDKCTIYSQDISQRSNKMLKLNLVLNGLISSLDHAIQGDTLADPYHKSNDGQELRKFDYIVSNPPFKMDFSDTRDKLANMPARFWAGVPKIPDSVHKDEEKGKKKNKKMAIYTCFIQHLLNSLNEKGKGAIVVPTGFLTSKYGIEKKILERIVDEHILYGVISMPPNVFATTGTNVSVLFFDNEKKSKDIILIDASQLGEEYKDNGLQKRRLRKNEIDLIVGTFLNRIEENEFSVIVDYSKIKENAYSLSAGQYFEIKIEHIEINNDDFKSTINNKIDSIKKLNQENSRFVNDLNFLLESLEIEEN